MLQIFALCAFLVGLDALVVGPLVPAISADLGFPPALGGLLVTAYGLMYGVSAPLFGPLSDRSGRKRMMLAGIVVFAVGTALTALAYDLRSALFFRGIAGLGGAMLMPSVYALIGDTFTYEQRGKAMGVIMGAMIGSQILGVPIGTFLAKLDSWRISFYLIAGIALVAFFIVLRYIPQTEPKRQLSTGPFQTYIAQFRTAFSQSSVYFALLATFFWTAGLQGMFAYVGVYYEQNFALRVDQIGLVAMFAAAASVLGSTLGGRLSDRWGKKTVISLAAFLSAGGVLCFALMTEWFWGAFGAQLIWALFVGCGQATLTTLISELNPGVRATVLSLNSSAMYLGMMAATAVSAYLLQTGHGFFSIGLMCAVAVLMVLPVAMYGVREGAKSEENQAA